MKPYRNGICITQRHRNLIQRRSRRPLIAFHVSRASRFDVLYASNAKYDGRKINWIGTAARGTGLLSVLRPAPAETLEQAKETEIVIGATGPGSASYQMPVIAAKMLGLQLKIVTGYKGGNSISLAMERGEVHGRVVATTTWVAQHSNWLKEGRLAHIIQIGPKDIKNFPDVPALSELVTDVREKKLLALLEAGPTAGGPLMLGPGVPANRVAAVREAFADMVKDPEFVDTMERRAKTDVDPMLAEQLTAFVESVLSAPPDIVQEAKSVLGLNNVSPNR